MEASSNVYMYMHAHTHAKHMTHMHTHAKHMHTTHVWQQIKLCQKWLHHRTAMVDQLATVQPPSLPSSRHNIAPASMCAYHLRSLLGRCCRDLIGHASQPLAVPLRTLEVFTSPETYASSAQHAHAHAHAQWLLQDLLLYLSKHG